LDFGGPHRLMKQMHGIEIFMTIWVLLIAEATLKKMVFPFVALKIEKVK
jgi:cytochrome c oxidase subunit IV